MHAAKILPGRSTMLSPALQVRRVLPAARQRSVGPFVFFDHFGPAKPGPDSRSDIAAHPHIGLATVSYLLEGSLMHRDSLGTVQRIVPGAINWMTAGRGIVHSERSSDAEPGQSENLHGLQLWVALPPALEEMEPAFQHVAAADIPQCSPAEGVQVRVLVGEAFGLHSPVRTCSETLYLDVQMAPGAQWHLPALAQELALYSPELPLTVDNEALAACHMAVMAQNSGAQLRAGHTGVRVMVLGGAPLEQPVRMWWNFVSTEQHRIAAAAQRWAQGGFAMVPGETDRIAAPPWK